MPEKDVYYLKHDSNSRNDPKILAMRAVYKWEGVGLYWGIAEILREQSDFTFPLDYDMLAAQLGVKPARLKQFMTDCIEKFKDRHGHGLFRSDGTCFWSDRLMEDGLKYREFVESRRRAGAQKKNQTPSIC